MRKPPTTSTTLLRVIGANPQSARWKEFIEKYEPYMIASVRKWCKKKEWCINDNEMEDVLQSIMIEIAKFLPNYRYAPEEDGKGRFHTYLFGVCRNTVSAFVRKRQRFNSRVELRTSVEVLCDVNGEEIPAPDVESMLVEEWRGEKREYEKWQSAVLEVALLQLMADPKIRSQHKEIFRLLAVSEEKSPEDVANMFNLTRNNVDQIKNRMMGKLRELASALRHIGMAGSKS